MMDDRFLKDRITDDNIEIPDSLKPENIAPLLDKAKKEKKLRARKKIISISGSVAGMAAAVIVGLLIFRPGFLAGTGTKSGIAGENATYVSQTGTVYDESDKPSVTYNDIYKRLGKNQTRDYLSKWASNLGIFGYKKYTNDIVYEAENGFFLETATDAAVGGFGIADSFTASQPSMAPVNGFLEESAIETPMASPDSDTSSGAETGKDYSGTNTQEALVDEADIIKTDGEYIYILKNGWNYYSYYNYSRPAYSAAVSIIDVDGVELAKIGEISDFSIGEDYECEINEMYVDGDRLVLVGTAAKIYDYTKEYDETFWYDNDYNVTFALTYDISDRENPQFVGSVHQSGWYCSSRKNGDYLYLISDFQVYYGAINKKNLGAYVPEICDELIVADDIYCPESPYMGYAVVAAVDIKNPSVYTSSEAVMLNPNELYMSPNSLYFKSNTSIVKYDYTDGMLFYRGEAEVKGYTDSQFSLNEYNGYLRIVTTKFDSVRTNGLYIFDGDMNMVGFVDNLAEGEQIKSSRFIGDMAYFVTFRNTDPLFAVDVSDPTNPIILSELKVTGFSEYLHPYGNGKLLGVGFEADPDTGIRGDVKLSMFDVSDSSNVYEASRYLISGAYYAPCMYDHHAILVDPTKNLIGFVSDGFGNSDSYDSFDYGSYYRLFRYNESNEFEMLLQCSVSGSYDVRGLYIGKLLYIVDPAYNNIQIYDLESYECVKVWEFNN